MADIVITPNQKLYIKFDYLGKLISVVPPSSFKRKYYEGGDYYYDDVTSVPRSNISSTNRAVAITSWFDVIDEVYQYEANSFITILNSTGDEDTSAVAGSYDLQADTVEWGIPNLGAVFKIEEKLQYQGGTNMGSLFTMSFTCINTNTTGNEITKEGIVHIHYFDRVGPISDYYFGLVITQYSTSSGREDYDYLYYYKSGQEQWGNEPLTSFPTVITVPEVAAEGSSNFYQIALQKYSNLPSRIPVDINLSITNDSTDWISWTVSSDSEHIYTIVFSASANDSSLGNESNIVISDGDTQLLVIKFTQTASEESGGPDPGGGSSGDGDEGQVTPANYWESGDIFAAIDDNLGEVTDAMSLLFKGGNTNKYKTIESKDNTLFLGNYIDGFNLYDLRRVLESAGSISAPTQKWIAVSNFCKSSNSSFYPYIPNMELSSKDKRVFKKGEKYMCGLVFVSATGQKSDVYYIGEFEPTNDSYLSDSTTLHKYVAISTIPAEVAEAAYRKGIRAVFPVYAVSPKHSVLAQGVLSSTVCMDVRQTNDKIDNQYAWFYPHSLAPEDDGAYTGRGYSDIQSEFEYHRDRTVVTLNTPETEVSMDLRNSDLVNSTMRVIKVLPFNSANKTSNLVLTVNNKYLHSELRKPSAMDTSLIDGRVLAWYGFLDIGEWNEETDSQFTTATSNTNYYTSFFVYPWNRSIVGGEGPTSKIDSKIFLNSAYYPDSSTLPSVESQISDIGIYRDYDTASLLKLGSLIYQGNVDYLIASSESYQALADTLTVDSHTYQWPRAYKNASAGWTYAGYDKNGDIKDPIIMRYKTAPHITMLLDSAYEGYEGCTIAEIISNNTVVYSDSDKEASSWIKCGDMIRIMSNSSAQVVFEEGDYFYGRFDSLRTYPYAPNEVNSVTDIVSCMLHSRVNLDARVDRNRGVNYPRVNNTNFNIFNPVYNQLNNFFTFQYLSRDNINLNRSFVNSIQWSLPKVYGAETDNWSEIQDVNTLDLDGNVGQLTAIKRLDNQLFAFQKSGISQILYNETMQLASTSGTPIEIGNSGRVNGKKYLTSVIGCQNPQAISQTPSGLYFVDGLNKSIYVLGSNGALVDLCSTQGMKSWSLASLDENWWCYYDIYSQEVLFANGNSCIAYSDAWKRFQCFLNYEKVKYAPTFNGRTYPIQFKGNEAALWLKNSVQSPTFFGVTYPVEVEFHVNPEPTEDKTFTDLEYRADGFISYDVYGESVYSPNATFDTIKVTNEYQDTGEVELNNYKATSSNLKRKFRIWRIQIPRDKTNRLDRIRNPWCHIRLVANMSSMSKFIIHDFKVLYTK